MLKAQIKCVCCQTEQAIVSEDITNPKLPPVPTPKFTQELIEVTFI